MYIRPREWRVIDVSKRTGRTCTLLIMRGKANSGKETISYSLERRREREKGLGDKSDGKSEDRINVN